MSYTLSFTDEAAGVLEALAASPQHAKKLKKVHKTLGLIERDPRYPGLNSHKYDSVSGVNGEEICESYVENRTPGAWRVFWHYGTAQGTIVVASISKHPN